MVKQTVLALLVFAACAAQADIYSYKAPDGSIVFTDQPVKGAKSVKVQKPMTVPAIKAKRERVGAPAELQWPETTLPRVLEQSPVLEAAVPGYDESQNTSWSSDTQGISVSPKLAKAKRLAGKKSAAESAVKLTKKSSRSEVVYRNLQVISPSADSSRWMGGELGVQLSLTPALAANHVVSLRIDGREVYVGPETSMAVPGVERGSHTLSAAVLDIDSGRQLIVSDAIAFHVQRPNKNHPTRMLHPSIKKR